MAGKRGGKWETLTWPGSNLVRIVRTADTGCGPVRVDLECHGGWSDACFGGMMFGPGKMRTPVRLRRYPHGLLGHVVTRREAMHVGDQMINEVRRRCGTRPRRARRAGPLGSRR